MTTAMKNCSPTDDMGDIAEVLRRVNEGDSAAWEHIVRRYGPLVSATVRSFRLQEADALDVIQITWMRLAENAHRVVCPEQLGGWLATIARHECFRIIRHAQRAPEPREIVAELVVDSSAGPEQRAIEDDTARTLWSLVEQLPPRQQTLVRALFSDHPWSYADVARSAGIPLGAIGPTRARALQQLRDKLVANGLDRRSAGPQRRLSR